MDKIKSVPELTHEDPSFYRLDIRDNVVRIFQASTDPDSKFAKSKQKVIGCFENVNFVDVNTHKGYFLAEIREGKVYRIKKSKRVGLKVIVWLRYGI